MAPFLFSAPVAVVLNQRLISSRGGLPSSKASTTLRFKLLLNSNPTSARYGLTLQISAPRCMSKEHNPDHTTEYQAFIFLPAKNFTHFLSSTPSPTSLTGEKLEELEITPEEGKEIETIVKRFCIPADSAWEELRHLRVFSTGAVLDRPSLPKLATESLESEIKRIFRTVEVTNEIHHAVLEMDCLISSFKGATDKAIEGMGEAAQKDIDARTIITKQGQKSKAIEEGKENHGEHTKHTPSPGAVSVNSWRSDPKLEVPKMGSFVSDSKQKLMPKHGWMFGADGKIAVLRIPVLPGQVLGREKTVGSVRTQSTSPDKYLHPHTFDPEAEGGRGKDEGSEVKEEGDESFNSGNTTIFEPAVDDEKGGRGGQGGSWRAGK